KRPPGKYWLPVSRVSTSAAARLNVLCPEKYDAKAGVTNVSRWYGSQFLARIHAAPLTCVVGSAGGPGQTCSASSPSNAASAACRSPGALLSGVITSIMPGTSGSPCGSYEGPIASDD